MEIPLLLDQFYLTYNVERYVTWQPEKPHMLLSVGLQRHISPNYCLVRCLYNIKDCEIVVCDFKNDDDYQYLEGANHFYRYTECQKRLETFYRAFQSRQSGEDKARSMKVLLFEE